MRKRSRYNGFVTVYCSLPAGERIPDVFETVKLEVTK
jgi:hypothetical protein